jgi:hypothetical protein
VDFLYAQGARVSPWKIVALKKLKVETIIERLRAHKMAHVIRKTESVEALRGPRLS